MRPPGWDMEFRQRQGDPAYPHPRIRGQQHPLHRPRSHQLLPGRSGLFSRSQKRKKTVGGGEGEGKRKIDGCVAMEMAAARDPPRCTLLRHSETAQPLPTVHAWVWGLQAGAEAKRTLRAPPSAGRRAAGQVLGRRGPHLESDQISGSQGPEASTGVSSGGPQAIYPGRQRGGLRGTSQDRRMCRCHPPKTCFVLVRGGGQGAWWGLHVHSLLPADPTAWAREDIGSHCEEAEGKPPHSRPPPLHASHGAHLQQARRLPVPSCTCLVGLARRRAV